MLNNHALQGKSVLVTRPRHQVRDLAEPLEALGAEVIVMPTIGIAPPEDTTILDDALCNLYRYDWVVLTSVNGVEAVRQRMEDLEIPLGYLMNRKIAVIGPSTAKAFAEHFRKPDLIPAEYVSEAIGEALGDVSGQRFLLARADLARRDLADMLNNGGAKVDEATAYRIVREANEIELPHQAPNYITLTSAEAARATDDKLKQKGRESWMRESAIACIGPITANAVRELGYEPKTIARDYTIPGLIEAMLNV